MPTTVLAQADSGDQTLTAGNLIALNADAAGTEIPGRVWVSSYDMRQAGSTLMADLEFWVVNDTGYLYELTAVTADPPRTPG